LFLPLIFFANPCDNKAGALRFAFKWLPQLFDVKFSSLSFSNNEALFIKQSKYFNLDFANFTSLFKSTSLLKSALTRYIFDPFFCKFFFKASAFTLDLL